MKKVLLLATLLTLTIAAAVDARIKVTGRGDNLNFDAGSIPPNYQATLNMMSMKCSKCHTMERTVVAAQTGKAPMTGQTFNKDSIRAYGIKMLRKPNSDLNKQEIRDIVALLNYIVDENKK